MQTEHFIGLLTTCDCPMGLIRPYERTFMAVTTLVRRRSVSPSRRSRREQSIGAMKPDRVISTNRKKPPRMAARYGVGGGGIRKALVMYAVRAISILPLSMRRVLLDIRSLDFFKSAIASGVLS